MTTESLENTGQSFSLGRLARVVLSPDVVIGHETNEAAHLRVQGPIHRQHALITRRTGSYWICSHPSRSGFVAVCGKPTDGSHPLRDGDEITVGEATQKRHRVQWRFRQLADSGTAVLHGAKPNLIVADGLARDAILLDDRLCIGRGEGAHLVLSGLPSDALVFERTALSEISIGLVGIRVGGSVRVFECVGK